MWCSHAAVGVFSRLARFPDASPGIGQHHQGQRDLGSSLRTLCSSKAAPGFSAALCSVPPRSCHLVGQPGCLSIPTLPLSFSHSALSSSFHIDRPGLPQAGYPTQPPSPLHPLLRLPPNIDLSLSAPLDFSLALGRVNTCTGRTCTRMTTNSRARARVCVCVCA